MSIYMALKPWKHYVPIKRNLSDLLEKIEWAKEHDEEAKKIAKRRAVDCSGLAAAPQALLLLLQSIAEIRRAPDQQTRNT